VTALPPDAVVESDEDGDLSVVTPRFLLAADHACFRRLGWRCALRGEGIDAHRIARNLVARGYGDVTRSPLLLELQHPARHRLLVVPRSARVVIRIDVETPLPERLAAAVAVAEDVAAASGP